MVLNNMYDAMSCDALRWRLGGREKTSSESALAS